MDRQMGQELWKAFLNGVLKPGFFSVRKESVRHLPPPFTRLMNSAFRIIMVIFLTIVVESELQAQWIESLHARSEPDG
jgi:hypothetical protein